MIGQPFQIRITLDHMRSEIAHYIATKLPETQAEINRLLDAAVASFDFGGEITRIAHDEIRGAIRQAVSRQVFDLLDTDDRVARNIREKALAAFGIEP